MYLYNNTILFTGLIFAQEAEPPVHLLLKKYHFWNSALHYHIHSYVSVSLHSHMIKVHILSFHSFKVYLTTSSYPIYLSILQYILPVFQWRRT